MVNSKKIERLVSYLSQIKLKTQLLFLVATLGAAIVASVIFNDLQNEKLTVNGPVYNKIVLQKDLVADILPPPEYLLEAWQVVLEMATLKPVNAAPYIEKGEQLRKDFETRHTFWKTNLAEGEMKNIMTEALYTNGMRFLNIRDQEFIPAFKANDTEAMQAAVAHMKSAYLEHRAAVDQVVALSTKETTKIEAETLATKGLVRKSVYIIFGLLILYAVVASSFVVLAIRKKLGGEAYEVLEAAQKIANGVLQAGAQQKLYKTTQYWLPLNKPLIPC